MWWSNKENQQCFIYFWCHKKLISIGNIINKYYIIIFRWIHFQIVNTSDPSKVITRRSYDSTNGLYKLESNSLESHVYLIEEKSIDLWYLRLRHVNFKTLHEMTNMVEGLPLLQTKNRPCRHCLEDKHRRFNISKKSKNKTIQRNNIIHTNLCRPMPTMLLSGFRYFIIFIDNYSKKT